VQPRPAAFHFIEAGQAVSAGSEEFNSFSIEQATKLKQWVITVYVAAGIHAIIGLLALIGADLNGLFNLIIALGLFIGARKLNYVGIIIGLSMSCLIYAVMLFLLVVASDAFALWLFIMALYGPGLVGSSGLLHAMGKISRQDRLQLLSSNQGSFRVFN
jgi:hypothetical protein